MRVSIIRRWIALLLLGLIASVAWAHDLGLTSISLTPIPNGTKIVITTPLSRVVQRAGLTPNPRPDELDQAVRSQLFLFNGRTRLNPTSSAVKVLSEEDMLTWESEVDAPLEELSLSQRFYPLDARSRTQVMNQSTGKTLEMDEAHPTWNEKAQGYAVKDLVVSGGKHIILGWDHVLFVIGLALFCRDWRSLLKVITAFTIGHSLTLIGLGLSGTVVKVAEPLISLSVVAVAIANLWPRRGDESGTSEGMRQGGLAFVFGLLHGFGFANGLQGQLGQGVELIRHILSFNFGVEIGQLLILSPVVTGLWWLRKKSEPLAGKVSYLGSLAIGMVGSYWFIAKLVGG